MLQQLLDWWGGLDTATKWAYGIGGSLVLGGAISALMGHGGMGAIMGVLGIGAGAMGAMGGAGPFADMVNGAFGKTQPNAEQAAGAYDAAVGNQSPAMQAITGGDGLSKAEAMGSLDQLKAMSPADQVQMIQSAEPELRKELMGTQGYLATPARIAARLKIDEPTAKLLKDLVAQAWPPGQQPAAGQPQPDPQPAGQPQQPLQGNY